MTNPFKDHSNPFRQSIWMSSPSHAWLAVPREILKRYELEGSISSCSYQGTHPDGTEVVYLEEDCDATKLIETAGVDLFKTAEGNGWIKEIQIKNSVSDFAEYYRV
jgi:hypothetical protein